MNATERTRSLVMKYFESWPRGDYETMRACLADRIDFDIGFARFQDADAMKKAAEEGPRWRDVTLLASLFHGERGTLFYTGVDSGTDKRMRVAEFITVREGKISAILAVAAPMP